MSSDEDFAGYGPTTPAPAKKTAATRGSRTAANAAPVAGPSKSSAPTRNGRKAQPKEVEEEEEVEVAKEVTVIEDESGDDEVEVVKPPTTKNKGKAPQSRTVRTSAKPQSKQKQSKKVVEQAVEDDVMEVDEAQSVDEPPAQKPPTKNVRAGKVQRQNHSAPPQQNGNSALRRELEELRREVEEVTAQRDKLAGQLDELFRIRQTEPEERLAEVSAQYEARLEHQETLLEEQSKLIAATTSDKPFMVHFLSRDAANEEKKELEREIGRSRDIIKQKDAQLSEKDQRIREVLQEKQMLEAELKAEVERSKSLASKHPGPPVSIAVGGKMSNVADPKMSAVFSLYEDITNVLVLKVKLEKGTHPGTDEKIFDCVYSAPGLDGDIGPSLHFNLRSLYEPDPEPDPSLPPLKQLIPKMQYIPLDLDKERPEYIERLEFFKEPFIFQYSQLNVFHKSLVDRFPSPQNSSQEEEEDDDIQEVEMS